MAARSIQQGRERSRDRDLIKQVALNLLRMSGAFDLTRLTNRHDALILTYHRFSSGAEDGKTPANTFAEQLEYLSKRYDIVPLNRVAESVIGNGRSPSRLAAITIDDGYRDAYEIAYPILRRRRAPATLFVPTDFIDRRVWIWTDKARFLTGQAVSQQFALDFDGRQLRIEINSAISRREASERINSRLKLLPEEIKEKAIERLAKALGAPLPRTPPEEFSPITWDEAREMQANGIEIGSHTLTHPILTRIGDERLKLELRESRSRLEEVFGRRIEHFCYPNGDHDDRVRHEVSQAGYRFAVTCVSGLNKKGNDPLRLRRIHTERDLSHFALHTSGFYEFVHRDEMKNEIWKGQTEHSEGV